MFFPPNSKIDNVDKEKSLASLGIKGGVLILKGEPVEQAKGEEKIVEGSKKLIRRIVDADNSCLFTCFSYILDNKSRTNPQHYRKIVSETVLKKKDLYSKVVLNQEPEDYAKWILTNTAWGGGIDIAILSEHFKIEVAVFDVQTTRVDMYGEGSKYEQRMYLLYNGIHYDPMSLNSSELSSESSDVTVREGRKREREKEIISILGF